MITCLEATSMVEFNLHADAKEAGNLVAWGKTHVVNAESAK
jgi:hypothetical protein